VAALAAGDIAALRIATEDRLHQQRRFEHAPQSRAAYEAALRNGAWASWLSGSGPTVASFCAPQDATRIAAALPTDGVCKILRVDRQGVVLLEHADA
jgi:homoserine kinase